MQRVITILFMMALLSACGSNPVTPEVVATGSDVQVSEYRIGVSDVLSVQVWRNADLSANSIPVRPDGMISIPLAGEIRAAGLTPAELSEIITEELGVYIRNPNVSVIVTQLNSHAYLSRIRITGAVNRAASLLYRPGMTVLDIILESGGVSEFAAPNRTKLYRKLPETGEVKIYTIRLDDILTDGDLTTNYALRPGDIISVPESFF